MHDVDRLWNGWRSAYVNGHTDGAPPGPGSIFTRLLESGLADVDTNIVYRGERCFAILNAFPYGTGHLLVLPYREVADLSDLTSEEAAELWSTVTDATAAIRAAYQPHGINIGVNLGAAAGGSVREHVHVHVVPRWIGDANFVTAIANARLLPEALVDTAARVRAAWPAVAGEA